MTSRIHSLATALALSIVSASLAQAQGVGINATGAAADTSAILDLTSSNKGLLVPRMTAAQRSAIVLPATGLVVYQTDGAAGLYFNAGTSASPSWQAVGANAVAPQWSVSGSNLYYSAGKVAIGTSSTTYGLSVMDATSGLRVQTNTSGGAAVSVGGVGSVGVDAPGVVNGRFSLLENGNLGLGVANPTNKLSFAATLGKKISLYPGASGDVGFGVSGNRLQIYADNPNADVALGYDAAGTFNERFAFKPTGAMAVNGNTGAAGQVLQSNGSAAAATWVNPTAKTTVFQSLCTTGTDVTNSDWFDVPGFTTTFPVTVASNVVVSYDLPITNPYCLACGGVSAYLDLLVDGTRVNRQNYSIANDVSIVAHSTWMVPLTPGSHTIRVAAMRIGTPTTRFGFNASLQGSLVVQVIPQ